MPPKETLLKGALFTSGLSAVFVPAGSYFHDGGVLHGLAIGLALTTVVLVSIVLRRSTK